MAEYVDEFLRAIRGNFPRVILDSLGGPDVIAEARRIPCQNRSFSQYNPKRAGGIYYNQSVCSSQSSCECITLIAPHTDSSPSESPTWRRLVGRPTRQALTAEKWPLALGHFYLCLL